MRIWTRKSASIQPRTSLGKRAVPWPAVTLGRGLALDDRVPARELLRADEAGAVQAGERVLDQRNRGVWISNSEQVLYTAQTWWKHVQT